MIRNYIKIAIRNLLKNKSFSAVSIIGLTLGFTGFIIVSLFIRYEFGWDKSHKNYDNIYRIQRYMAKASFAKDGNDISPHTYAITASLLKKFPEFEKLTIIQENMGNFLSGSTSKEYQLYDETGIYADQNFLDIFTYNFIEGSPHGALSEPFSMALSKSMAEKLFGDEKVVGKTVLLEKKFNFKVTGVYHDLPKNSSICPGYIASISTLKRTENIELDKSWAGNFMIYALLKPDVNLETTRKKIENVYGEFKNHEFEELQLCPLSQIYLSFNGRNDYYVIIVLFGIIGVFILVMSAFNYVNFTISNASTRSNEVAIRKLSGVNKFSLIAQFQSETLFLSLASSVAALGLVKLILPLYNSFTNTAISITLANDWKAIIVLMGISLVIGFLAGIYPSIIMSSHRIIKLFKEGMLTSGRKKVDVKKALVTLQFAISMFLICLTIFFMVQVNFMTTKDLGFNKENLIYATINITETEGNFEGVRNRLLKHPEIINASMSKTLPFVNSWGGMINWEGSLPDEKILYRPNWVAYDFVNNLGLDIVKGRDFSKEYPSDLTQSCIINETALSYFGWADPIGKRINDNKWTVIGVVKDYHIHDMHNKIEPVVLFLASGELQGEWNFTFRYLTGKRKEVKQVLIHEFNKLFPNDPFEFKDVNSAFLNERAYKMYQTIKKSMIFFTVFIISLSIIGLLGIVSYTTMRRTKEIGVRKINGSTVSNIFLLLNRDFLLLLIISVITGIPLAYLAYGALPGSYKIAPQWWVPVLTLLVIVFIVLITTFYQTFKAARRNPIEALRYE